MFRGYWRQRSHFIIYDILLCCLLAVYAASSKPGRLFDVCVSRRRITIAFLLSICSILFCLAVARPSTFSCRMAIPLPSMDISARPEEGTTPGAGLSSLTMKVGLLIC